MPVMLFACGWCVHDSATRIRVPFYDMRQVQTCKTLCEHTYERVVWFRLVERLVRRHWLPLSISYLHTVSASRLERLATASKRVPYTIKYRRPLRWRSVFPFTFYGTLGHIGAATMLPGGVWWLVATVDPYALHPFN